MQKKWIFFSGIVVCLLLGGWALYSYYKPRSGTSGIKADFTMDAATLYTAFNTDEAAANERFNGKIIAVQGTVSQVLENENGTIILLSSGDEMGGVSCSFSNTKKEQAWPPAGALVTIKGRCSGFLMDVNLVDAVLMPLLNN